MAEERGKLTVKIFVNNTVIAETNDERIVCAVLNTIVVEKQKIIEGNGK